jgi:predicted nucleic acid-binding protein
MPGARCVRGDQISRAVDTSFLIHALVPLQATPEATAELRDIRREELIASPGVHLEFASFLRKLLTRGLIDNGEGQEMLGVFLRLRVQPIPIGEAELREAWDLASLLNQSDIFDSMGYVLARQAEAEFVTSDRRFGNAAGAQSLGGVRYIP